MRRRRRSAVGVVVESWLVGALALVGAVIACSVLGTAFGGFGAGTVVGAGIGIVVGIGVYLAVATAMVRAGLEPTRRRGAYVAHLGVAALVVTIVLSIVERA